MNRKHTNIEDVYLFHLEKAYKQFKKYKTDYFRQKGIDLTSDQWVLLKGVYEDQGISQRTLAQKCFKEPASVTRILNKLEERGWIKRKSLVQDKRTHKLYVTAKGQSLVEKVQPMAKAIKKKGTDDMFEQEVSKLNELLVRLYENFA